MTTTASDPTVSDKEYVARQLRALRRLPGVTATLVATTDGRSYFHDFVEVSPGSAAAITASSLALAARLGDLTDPGAALLELQVRTSSGYVCLYAVDSDHLLGVVTAHTVNLARLKLETRDVISALAIHLGGTGTSPADPPSHPRATP
ncbi:MAG: roadblock/LC7 domain-containing protein [Acidimicrobiales bacterium]